MKIPTAYDIEKWAYDTLTLKVKTKLGYLYLTRFIDEGSNLRRTYGHADFTKESMEKVIALLRAYVRPWHGEIWIGRRDGHPSLRSKYVQADVGAGRARQWLRPRGSWLRLA